MDPSASPEPQPDTSSSQVISLSDGDMTRPESPRCPVKNKGKENFRLAAHQVLARLKVGQSITTIPHNELSSYDDDGVEIEIGGYSNGKEEDDETSPNDTSRLSESIKGILPVTIDTIVDIVLATIHFSNGRYYTGALTLFFVFGGGAMVTLCLNVFMRRKGNTEFKAELKKIHPILPYLTYVPSLLPFFSGGMKIYTARKLYKLSRSEDGKNDLERTKWRRLFQICEEHAIMDLVYESSYEAYGQAILQAVIMLEKPIYDSFDDYVPVIGIIISLLKITLSLIRLSVSINGVQVKWTGFVAGLANKGLTLLSFTLFISASRAYFSSYADDDGTSDVGGDLVWTTVIVILVLSIFSELPGIVMFQLELRQVRKNRETRLRRRWEIVVNFISLIIPPSALAFWLVTLNDQVFDDKVTRVAVLCSLFGVSFGIGCIGFFAHKNLPWLGQFSTDQLLLFYISLYSHFHDFEFQEIGFHFDSKVMPMSKKIRVKISHHHHHQPPVISVIEIMENKNSIDHIIETN